MFPQKDAEDNYITTTHKIIPPTQVKQQLTFTPKGKQVVWSIDLYATKVSTQIADIDNETPGERVFYNMQGVKIDKPQKGILIEKTHNTTRKRIY